jgi:hypothetical protein
MTLIAERTQKLTRAKLFYDKLIHELKNECVFSLQLWSFQVLAIPEIRESAADSITQADFVILSLHGKAGLLARIRQWIETWSRQIFDEELAATTAAAISRARDLRLS